MSERITVDGIESSLWSEEFFPDDTVHARAMFEVLPDDPFQDHKGCWTCNNGRDGHFDPANPPELLI